MKKLFVFAFAFFMLTAIDAQINFGAKAGLNRTNLKDIHGDSNSRYGFYLGGFAQIPFTNYGNQFYIQPELIYSQQGEKNQGNNLDEVYQFDYITVPILFRAYFSEKEDEFFGELGPQMGFMISDKVKINNNAPTQENPAEVYQKFDLGGTVGLGFSLNRKFEFNVRYYLGFVDVVENDVRDTKNWTSNLHGGIAYIF